MFHLSFDECYDDDLDYDDVVVSKTAMYFNFIEKNPATQTVDAIIFNTGYTDRVITKEELIINLKPSVVLTDKNWDKTLKPYVQSGYEDLLRIAKMVSDSGLIAFEEQDASYMIDYLKMLEQAEYCSCCGIYELETVDWLTFSGKTVMVVKVDTESG